MGKYFGTDGVRGVAFEKLDANLAYKIGQGLSHAIDSKEVIIGYDTRLSSPMLAYMIAAGALSEGCHVRFAGVCSTPMVAYYSKEKEIIGVMVTASHNPYTDNGIKVFNKGFKTTEDEEHILEKFIDEPKGTIEPFGTFEYATDFKEIYLKVYEQFELIQTNIKLAYDSANGANYQIAHELISKVAPNSTQIGNVPDGLNINKGCGSTHMELIQEYVRTNDIDLGFSFDGDGDRLLICDKDRVYDGDEIIYIISNYLKKKGQLSKNHVVLTKMSNPGILRALKLNGIDFSLTDVGDKYVSLELTSNDYIIGGENSGHIIMRHLLHTGDGLLVAMYLLSIIAEEKKSISELTSDITLFPYQLINIKDVDKSILQTDEMKRFLSDVKHSLGEDSLLLVRPSGTENLIRVTVSHQNEHIMKHTILSIVSKIKNWGDENHA
jgi:phosphoglucosamine mutase